MFIIPNPRTSEAIEAIKVDPVQGTVVTRFRSNGYEYKYSNVSRRKIFNLLVNPNMSLGFWVQSLVKDAVLDFDGTNKPVNKLSYKLIGATYNSKQQLSLA